MTIRLFQSIHALDVAVFSRIMTMPGQSVLARWFRKISWTADGYLYVLFGIYLLLTANYPWARVMAWGFAMERSIYFLAKNGFKRRRPEQALTDIEVYIRPADMYSFPSGHTSGAFLFSFIVYGCYGASALTLFVWACTVAFSRMIMGLHFMSDLLCGALLGFSCFYLAHLIVF